MRPSRRFLKSSVAALGAILLSGQTAHAQTTVKLAWNPNPETDIAGYIVWYGTASGDYTTAVDAGNTTGYDMGDLIPATTYFFALQAYNSAGLISDFSDEIEFTTLPDGGYGAWAQAASLSGTDAFAHSMPWQDGVPNLLKFAFNMNPHGPDRRILERGTGTAGLPLFTMEESGTGRVFRVEFLRRRDGSAAYAPMVSTDLLHFAPMTGTSQVTTVDAAWERVVLQRPCDPVTTPRLFGRVEVSIP